MNIQIPGLIRIFYRNFTWRKYPSGKVIYLTFDDGPVPEVTPYVLDILDFYDWKATFFCVGENVQKNPDLYAEIIRRGHKTANHSFNHVKGYDYSTDEYVANVKEAAKLIDSKLFRPPYGKITRKQTRILKKDFEIIMWDVITHDYNQNLSHNDVFNNVKNNLKNGSIVVFHDSIKARYNVLKALPDAIEFWRSKGYEFGLL